MQTMTIREKDAVFQIRVAADELEQWRAAAKAADMTLAMWLGRAARAAMTASRSSKRSKR